MNIVTAAQPARAHIIYHKQMIPVIVESTFQGANGLMVNVKAVEGFPFLSADVQSQGDTSGPWNCNGYRVRTDFVMIEAHGVEAATAAEDVDGEAEIAATLAMLGMGEFPFSHEDWMDEKRTQEEARL